MNNKFSEESIEFIKDHINDDPAELMLGAHKHPELPMKEIVVQIASRQKAKEKLPEWFENERIVFPPKQNLEQASSEITAKFKARFLDGKVFIDLTGGTGIDTFYISENFQTSWYVEPNKELCKWAEHNFEELGAGIEVFNATAEELLAKDDEKVDWIYIDPSRRDEQKNRVYALEDCVPNVLELEEQLLNTADHVLIKTSPMLDIKKTIRQFKNCYKIQVLAVQNEVKELLVYLSKGLEVETEIEAWNVSPSHEDELFSFKYSDDTALKFDIGEPQKYLYEPNASLMKAGAYKLISEVFELKKIHSNTHLYTSDKLVNKFPGKRLSIKEIFNPSKKEIKKRIPDGKVNVVVRNYPMGANEVKKKFKLRDGGADFLVFCETAGEGLKAFWCNRV